MNILRQSYSISFSENLMVCHGFGGYSSNERNSYIADLKAVIDVIDCDDWALLACLSGMSVLAPSRAAKLVELVQLRKKIGMKRCAVYVEADGFPAVTSHQYVNIYRESGIDTERYNSMQDAVDTLAKAGYTSKYLNS